MTTGRSFHFNSWTAQDGRARPPVTTYYAPTSANGASVIEMEAATPSPSSRLLDWGRDRLKSYCSRFSREVLGLQLFVLSTLFSSGMSLMAKLAGQRGVPVFQVVLIRSLFLLLFTTPQLVKARINPFHSDRQWLLLLRGFLGFCGVSSLYWAVSLLPMAEATVLSFLAPVIVAVLSPALLHERPSRSVLVALPFCITGVLLVAKPAAIFGAGVGQAGPTVWGTLVGLIQAFFSATAKMCVRALSSSAEPVAAVVFSMGAMSTLGSMLACAVLRSFVIPGAAATWIILIFNGIFGYANQVTLTAALQRAKAAPAISMSYCSVLWGILADLLVFHTSLSGLSLLGAAIICATSFWVAYSEKKRSKASSGAGGQQGEMELGRSPAAEGYARLSNSADWAESEGEAESLHAAPSSQVGEAGARTGAPVAGGGDALSYGKVQGLGAVQLLATSSSPRDRKGSV